jgi:hypothetical protein
MAGRTTRIRPKASDSDADIDLHQIAQVEYRRQDISGNRFVRWMSDRGFYLGGWGGKIFLSVFFLLLIFTAVWSWLVIVANERKLQRRRVPQARPNRGTDDSHLLLDVRLAASSRG